MDFIVTKEALRDEDSSYKAIREDQILRLGCVVWQNKSVSDAVWIWMKLISGSRLIQV